MTRTVLELVALLIVATGLSVVALFVTAILLATARTDLKAIKEAEIGNGRRAAARGEHRLAWARFVECMVSTVLSGALVWIGALAGLGDIVGPRWVVVVVAVALIDGLVLYKAIISVQTRTRIFDLAEHGDLGRPPKPGGKPGGKPGNGSPTEPGGSSNGR